MTRCRLSSKGKAKGLQPRQQDREGEYLGLAQQYINSGPNRGTYRTDEERVQVRWDGIKTVQTYHRDYIEIIDEKKYEPEDTGS
jgi:hypothetical protein